jgi:hypothetical protein
MRRFGSVALGVGGMLAVGCGSGEDDGGGGDTFGGTKAPRTAEQLVEDLYGALAIDDADTACALFSPSGQAKFVEGTGMPDCAAAVDAIANQVEDREAFAHPTIEIDDPEADDLDEWCSQGISVNWPDLDTVYDRNGPTALASFAYGKQVDGTWAVTDYNTSSCG